MSFISRFTGNVPKIVGKPWIGGVDQAVWEWMGKISAASNSTVSQLTQIFGTPGGALQGLLTTLGDLLTFDGTNPARLPVGDPLAVLAADPSAALGLSYQAQLVSLMQRCVSFWRLEEALGSQRLDAISANDLTPINAPTQVSGKVGNAAGFDAASSRYLAVRDVDQLGLNPGTGNFSLSLWFYPIGTTGTGAYALVYKGCSNTGSAAGLEGYHLFLQGSGAVFPLSINVAFNDDTYTGPFPGAGIFSGLTATLNAWNHLVVSFNRSGNFRLWLNGVEETTPKAGSFSMGLVTGDCTPSGDFRLGADASNLGTPATAFFDGRIDAVGYFNAALTTADVAALYGAGRGLELFPLWQSRGVAGVDAPVVNRRPPANVTIRDGYGLVSPVYYDLAAFGVTLDLQGDAVLEIL